MGGAAVAIVGLSMVVIGYHMSKKLGLSFAIPSPRDITVEGIAQHCLSALTSTAKEAISCL